MTDIRSVDLNLLVAFEAMLATGSVSRAAFQLSIGQSAMSYNLARLRRLFDDELFIRTPDGMKPTPKAVRLSGDLAVALAGVRSLLRAERPFDPAQADMNFNVGVTDAVEVLLIPTFSAIVREKAPGVRLRLFSIERMDVATALDAGTLDLAIGVFSGGKGHHKRRVIYSEGFHMIFNADLVDMPERPTLEDALRWPLLLIEGGASDPVRATLGRLKPPPHIAVQTPHLLAAPLIVARSPLVALVHTRLALLFADTYRLSGRPAPEELGLPQNKLLLMWHPSSETVAAHGWMRSLVVTALANLKSQQES